MSNTGKDCSLVVGLVACGPGPLGSANGSVMALKRRRRRLCSSDRGSAHVELAVTMPVALTILTGILSIGICLSKKLELTNGTSASAQYLALNRGITTDPCGLTVSTFQSVTPFLDSTSANFAFVLNGTSYAANTTSCTGGAANLVQGGTVTVTITYPCTLAIFGVNLAPGCTLVAQSTQIVQ